MKYRKVGSITSHSLKDFKTSSKLTNYFFHQGARMVRELFEMARTKKACLIFFDEIDAIGGKYGILENYFRMLLEVSMAS